MKNVKVAVAQMDCELGSVERNLARIREITRTASALEPEVICFPELATTGYSLGPKWRKFGESTNGPTVESLSRIAREFGCYLICGMVESEGKKIFDSAVLLSPSGSLVGTYRKIHLWGQERRYFTPGYEFPTFKTKDIGTIGIGICYDVEFPESARSMALKGAELLFFPSAEFEPMRREINLYVKSRSLENCAFVAFSNRIGKEGKITFFGDSQIVSPDFNTLAIAEDSKEGFALGTIDYSLLKEKSKTLLPYLKHIVPDAYERRLRSVL